MTFSVVSTASRLTVNSIVLFDAHTQLLPGPGVVEKVTQTFVRKVYPLAAREQILRAGTVEEREALDAFFDQVGAIKASLVGRYASKTLAIEYEQAIQERTRLETLINGVPEVPGIPGIIDPGTGEVTPAVPSVPAVAPLATTVMVGDQTVSNPAYLAATAALADLQTLIDAVSNDPEDAVRAMIILRGNV